MLNGTMCAPATQPPPRGLREAGGSASPAATIRGPAPGSRLVPAAMVAEVGRSLVL
jgi:hypothetical protein